MDNRIFNVNGKGEESLLKTLELAFLQSGYKTAVAWRVTEKHGLILYWALSSNHNKDISKFPSPVTANEVLPTVLAWLNSDAKTEMTGWDRDADHDGDNGKGWRVFCEDWGHVADDWSAFIAIKPAMMWYGK